MKAKQAHLEARMAQCFPAARVLNDMTVGGEGNEVQGTRLANSLITLNVPSSATRLTVECC